MNDQSKTKHDLIQELVSLRKRIAGLSQYESEHKQVEESLRESEYKYKSLIENIPDIIFIIIDLEGKITFISKRTKEILGYENEETINRNILNFISEEAHQSTMEKLQKGMEGEKIKHVQLPVTAKSGKKLFFDFSFSRIYKNGVVVGAQDTAVDVTERKLAEELLKQSEAKRSKVPSACGPHARLRVAHGSKLTMDIYQPIRGEVARIHTEGTATTPVG
jgi:PAS domain S-box-containing protein